MSRLRDKSYYTNYSDLIGHASQYFESTGNLQVANYRETEAPKYNLYRKWIKDELLPRKLNVTGNCVHKSYHEYVGEFSHTGIDNACSAGYFQKWENVNILHFEQKGGMTDYPDVLWIENNLGTKDTFDSGFSSRAWQAMKPSLEKDVSLTNFLLELKDLHHIRRLFTSNSSLVKKFSEYHLTWAFGIKPMIRDLDEIWTHLGNTEAILKDFKERSRYEQTRYYSESDVQSPTRDVFETKQQGTQCIHWYTEWLFSYSIKRTARMVFTYTHEEIDSFLGKLKALRAIFGLKFTQSVLWEATPFSFIVDYVLNVQRWLESRESDLIEPDVIISDYSVSYKIVFDVKGWFNYPTTTGPWERELIHTAKGSIYDRRRTLPDTDGEPLQLSLPSSNQLALLGSLINVNRR